MGFVLRAAGEEFEETLGSTGIIATCITPSTSMAKTARKLLLAVDKNPDALEKCQRRVFGAFFVRLDGVEVDGEDVVYDIEKDDNAWLTDKALDLVRPLGRRLQDIVIRLLGLEADDAKN